MPSSTARGGGITYPIARSLAVSFNSTPEGHSQRRIGSFLILTAYYGNVITSAMFVTSMAANPLIVSLLSQAGYPITWGQWALASLLPGILSLIFIPYIVFKIYPPEVAETPGARKLALGHLREMGGMSKYEWVTLAVFSLLIFLWIGGEQLFNLDSTAVAFLGLSAFLLTGVLTWDDIKKEHEAWDTLIWFSTLVMIATYLNHFGLIEWMSGYIRFLMNGMEWWSAFPLLILIYFYSHYLFAGNTAHVTSMFAAFFSVGVSVGTPPYLMALSLASSSSLFACLTHYGTGCAPIFFGSEYVNLKTWWRLGFIISMVFLLIWGVIGSLWWKVLGFW
jgi:DASS family divalent anion:Na+ symporter